MNFKRIIRDIQRILRTKILRESCKPHVLRSTTANPSQAPILNDHVRICQMNFNRILRDVLRIVRTPGAGKKKKKHCGQVSCVNSLRANLVLARSQHLWRELRSHIGWSLSPAKAQGSFDPSVISYRAHGSIDLWVIPYPRRCRSGSS